MTLVGPHSTSSSSNGRSPSIGSLSAPLHLTPGQIVAERYKVMSVVGRGNMGSVYKVEQIFLRKIFALKTLNSIAASDLVVRRFQKEAQAASRLEHPNLVRAVDFGLIEGAQPFFVMEFVNGITLDRYLREHRSLSIDEVRAIFVPICRGMSYAHQEGVIHRDIKPSNIVLVQSDSDDTYTPRIVDFGIAKLDVIGEGDDQALTETGEVFGTPLYMSPEQCTGDVIDKRSDIYSLGCVLFEALTGAPPFRGRNAIETMMLHRLNQPVSLKQASLGEEFSPGLEEIVAKMLAKEPHDRYRDCLEVARDLATLKVANPRMAYQQNGRTLVSKLDAFGNLNLTITGRMGSIFFLGWILVSALILFALSSTHEQVHTTAVPAVVKDENHDRFLFNALAGTRDDQSLALEIGRQPTLNKLNLQSWKGTDNGLSALTKAKFLRELRLQDCTFLTNKGLKYLIGLPLQTLNLDDLNIGDKGMESVSKISSLESLTLRKTDVGDQGVVLLSRLPRLKTLNLSETGVEGRGLYALARMPQLTELYLDHDPGVRNFVSILPIKLTALSLAKDKISDDELDRIVQMRGLNYLSLDDDVDISDKGLLKLAQLPRLNYLHLRNCGVTHAGIRKFKLSRPTCEIGGLDVKKATGSF